MKKLYIEPCLERKKKSTEIPTWLIFCLMCAIATLSYFIVAVVVDDQAHASYNAHKELCDRYMADTTLEGTAAQETLNDLCN